MKRYDVRPSVSQHGPTAANPLLQPAGLLLRTGNIDQMLQQRQQLTDIS